VRALLRLATVAGVVVAAVAVLQHLAGVPDNDMSASRLVPATALVRGFTIYAGPTSGPIVDFMYGPVAALAFVPVALATSPSGALAIGVVLNAAAFFLPIAWLLCDGRRSTDVVLAALVLFVLVVVRDPGLAFSALTIHADAPALGLGALACGLCAGGRGRPRRIAAAGCAVALAVWTKQTMAPLAIALVAATWLRDGARPAIRLATWIVAVGALLGALACAVFGPYPLAFNMVILPSRMPWYGEAAGGGLGTVLFVSGLVLRLTWLPALAVIALLAWSRRSDAAGAVRVRASPAGVLAGVALVLAPAAILAGAKVGGYLNTFSVTSYFLVAALATALAAAACEDDRGGRVARATLAVGLVALSLVVARGPVGIHGVGTSVARLRNWAENPHERAYRTAREHPGEIYLPWNPLATLLAENRLDNNEIGAWNRDLAGVPIDDELWRRFLPPRLRVMAFRPPSGAFTWLPEPTARLPEFTLPATIPGLDGWTVLGRAVAAPSGAGLERDPHVAPAPPRP
jgi:hypothetical protein